MQKEVDYKNVYYPPGGILLWMIIMLELITFGVGLIVMVFFSREDPTLFHASRLQLNVTIGTVNTVLLLTSGFFMANTVTELKRLNTSKARIYLLFTMLFGFGFLILKAVEYSSKIDAGLVMGTNDFYTFYWLLTGFHAIHVLVGLVILGFILVGISKQSNTMKLEDIEAGAAFWHMCDLIWLLLFPIIYLIF